MELVNYKMYKDDNLIYENTCPVLFAMGVIPALDIDIYDYIEINFKGTTTFYSHSGMVEKWK
jgi:hypothetical protein